MSSNPKLSNHPLIRRGLGAVLSVNLMALTAVLAQPAPAAEPIEMERMIVTGTRLTSAEAEGTLSVTAVDVEEPINVGFPRLADLVRTRLPQYGGAGIINEGYGNGGNGASTISLRGLPSNATLLLVNGRRVSAGDLNQIPEAAVERVEILNDGAGAIYGSDAVAGVVNIILKEDFNGVQLGGYYGNTTETDVSERKFTAAMGVSDEKTSFFISAEYSASNDQMSVDRDRSMPSGDQVSGTSNPGTFSNPSNFGTHEVVSGDSESGFVTNNVANRVALRWSLVPGATLGLTNASQIPAGFDPFASVDTTSATSASQANSARNAAEAAANAALPADSPVRYGVSPSLMPGVNPGFPYGVYTIAYRPHEKYGANFSGVRKIYDEHLSFFMNGYYVRNQSTYQLAPSPLAGRRVGAQNYWLRNVFGVSTNNTTQLAVSYRPVEIGPRITYDDFETFRGVTGLRGKLVEEKLDWELGFMWDRATQRSVQTGGVQASVYDSLLAATDAGAWNPFGYTPIGGTSSVNSQDTVNSLGAEVASDWEFSTMQVDFRLSGNVGELPAGALGFAVGAEARREKMNDQPGYAVEQGLVFPFNVQSPLEAMRDVGSFYGELLIPIFSPDMRVPALTDLSFSIALRHETYSDVGDTGVKPRFAFRWQPVKDLTIRGSYSEGFIAPTFYGLYAQPGQDFQELYNPLTGIKTQAEEGVLTIGNPELKPSDAESYLIGFMYSPSFLKGFSIGANYYNITQNGIPFESAQYIVNQWWAAGGASNPSNPYGANAAPSGENPLGSQVELTSAGDLYQVRNVGPINTGERKTDGIDLILAQEVAIGSGTLTFTGQATHILSFEQENFPGAGSIDYLGRYWSSGAALPETGFPEWRANVTVSYEWQRLTAAIAWNYVQGYEEDIWASDYDPDYMELRDVRDYNTFDVRLGYKIPKVEADILVGCNNVFDEQPPMVLSSFESNVDRSIVDLRGRMWFVNLSKKF